MEYIRSIAQLIIALGILNVWLLRFNKATSYRGGAAKNMTEEFATYGLPVWFMWVDLFRFQQGRDNDDRPGTKAGLLNLYPRFTNHQNIRKRIVRLLIH